MTQPITFWIAVRLPVRVVQLYCIGSELVTCRASASAQRSTVRKKSTAVNSCLSLHSLSRALAAGRARGGLRSPVPPVSGPSRALRLRSQSHLARSLAHPVTHPEAPAAYQATHQPQSGTQNQPTRRRHTASLSRVTSRRAPNTTHLTPTKNTHATARTARSHAGDPCSRVWWPRLGDGREESHRRRLLDLHVEDDGALQVGAVSGG